MRRPLPRLIYGFLSASAEGINIKMPWGPSERDGLFKMNYSTADAVTDNLRFWAKTNKGERVMDFEFGLDARRYVFEPETVAKDKIINNAREQLPKYFSDLIVEELDVISNEDDDSIATNSLRFILRGKLRSDQNIQITVDEVLS
jgi:phage baseplate assembly protein W